jgi:ABC-type transport system involved in multi-copper enzyme maturation permease subunit
MTVPATETATSSSMMPRGNAFLDGLSCGFRALLAKEIRAGSRGWRFTLMLTGYLCALAAFVAGFLGLARMTPMGTSPLLGLQLFTVLAFGTVLLVTIITVAVTSGAISGERERRTLDLMLVTRASALGLVTGKLAGSLIHVLFLLSASLPAFALVYLFGGVPALYLVLFFVVACTTAAFYASLGLLFSAWLRRTVMASVLSFVVMLVLVAGVPITAGIVRENRPHPENPMRGINAQGWNNYAPFMFMAMRSAGPPTTFAYTSPLIALASVLPTSGDDEFSLAGPMLQLVTAGTLRAGDSGFSLFRAMYVDRVDQASGAPVIGATWAPWLFYVLLSLAAVPVALFLASIALSPKRGRRRRGRAHAAT